MGHPGFRKRQNNIQWATGFGAGPYSRTRSNRHNLHSLDDLFRCILAFVVEFPNRREESREGAAGDGNCGEGDKAWVTVLWGSGREVRKMSATVCFCLN